MSEPSPIVDAGGTRPLRTMRDVVVTGGAGFIGSHLAEALVKAGIRVTVFDNFSSGRRDRLAAVANDVQIVAADINDADAIAAAMAGKDTVFHLAAVPSVPRSLADPATSHRANIDGTFSVLMAARAAGVERVVYASSSSAYGNNPAPSKQEDMPTAPRSPYALQKLVGEIYTLQFDAHFGVEGVAIRFFNVFGPRQDPYSQYAGVIPKFIALLKAGERPTINGDGTITRDFTYIDNVVDILLRAARVPDARGRVFNAGCGDSISLGLMVEKLNLVLGTAIEPLYGPERPGDVQSSRADISRARSILGYEPFVDFEEGLRRTAASFEG